MLLKEVNYLCRQYNIVITRRHANLIYAVYLSVSISSYTRWVGLGWVGGLIRFGEFERRSGSN